MASIQALSRFTVIAQPRVGIFHRIAAALRPSAYAPLATTFGINLGLLGGLLGEMILRAVPKQRTSHSKKRKRMATKGLKNRYDLVPCLGCGRPKLSAHICQNCYHDIKRRIKDMKPSTQ